MFIMETQSIPSIFLTYLPKMAQEGGRYRGETSLWARRDYDGHSVVKIFPRVIQRGGTTSWMNPRLHVPAALEAALNKCQHSLDKPVSAMEATRTHSRIYKSWLVQIPRG